VGIALLVAQLAWFAHEQAGRSRYFCWAPLHEHVWYRVDARHGGRTLTEGEVVARYGRLNAFHDRRRGELWELNAAQHVLDSVARRERSLPEDERVAVSVTYRIDDREPRTWTYTP
jgi:uncharacterized protein YifE (UPF0438 family)